MVTSSDPIMALCRVYNNVFWPLTGSSEMNTGDNLFASVGAVFTEPSYNVRSKSRKVSQQRIW